jgi:spore maturation protein CgeB
MSNEKLWSHEERKHCPVCSQINSYAIGKKTGRLVKQEFEIRRCRTCDLVYVSNPLHRQHLNEIYNEEYFHGSGMDDSVNYFRNLEVQEKFFAKYDWQIGQQLKQYRLNKGLRWLDVGCALGNTLDWAKNRYQAKTFGVEFSEVGRKTSADRGHTILGSELKDVEGQEARAGFDIITAYEVLEHLYEPMEFFSQLPRLLKDGGVFHYSTGNPSPNDAQILPWNYVRPEVHIIYYSPKCMNWIFKNIGLKSHRRVHNIFWSSPLYKEKLSFKRKLLYLAAGVGIDPFHMFQPDGRKPQTQHVGS